MAFKIAEAFVQIAANLNPLAAGINMAKKMMSGLGSIIKTALGPIGLIISGAVGIFESVKAYAEAEAIEKGLASALKATGQEVDGNMSKFKQFASDLQKVTTIGDDAVLEMITLGTNMGLTADQAQEATKAAVGLSRAYGIDTTEAMKAVVNEMSGVQSSLNEKIPALKAATDATSRMNAINDAATAGMAQELDAVDTLEGGWTQFTGKVGDLGEKVGELLSGHLSRMLAWVSTFVDWLMKAIEWVMETKDAMVDAFKKSSEQAGTFAHGVMAVFEWIKDAVKVLIFSIMNIGLTWDYIKEATYNTFVGMGARIAWFGKQIANVAGWIWRNFSNIFTDIFNLGTTIFTNLVENIGTLFSNLWKWLTDDMSTDVTAGLKGLTEGFQSSIEENLEFDKFVPPELEHEARERFNAAFAEWSNAGEDAKEKIKEEMSQPIDLKLNAQGVAKQAEQEKKQEGKDKDDGSGRFSGFAQVWRDMQAKIIEADVQKKQLAAQEKIAEEAALQTAFLERIDQKLQPAGFA